MPRAGGAPVALLRRLIHELRTVATTDDADVALSRLRVRIERDAQSAGRAVAIVEETEGGERLDAFEAVRSANARTVRIARGVYARVPTSEARVRLLSLAARAATTIEVHVAISDDGSHLGRLAIDAPRRLLRAVGARAAEPGDRFGPDRYTHCFFDEETLLDEVRRAGLVIASRRGFVFSLRRADAEPASAELATGERAEPFATELARVVRRVRDVDARRRHGTPERVLADLRRSGAATKERGPVGRARLRRAIGWVDAALPGGPNCYRRILLELSLDAGAARETVVFGLDVGSTGHVAFADREERAFDVAFSIPAVPPRAP